MSISINNLDNLIKNFYIFGVEPEDIDISELEKNYLKKDILQIKLLSKFPPLESENNQMISPNIIISHCFPNGLILKSSEKPINDYEFFHFNLENLYQISHSDKIFYFTCCIFYENINEYIIIKNKQKNSNNKINNKNIYIPKLICMNSFYQYPNQFKTILQSIISYSKSKEIKVPIEKIIENIILDIPSPQKFVFYPSLENKVLTKSKIDFDIGDINKVRFFSYKMQMIYVFKVEDILEIYKWILLEEPVLFFSEDKEKLTNIFETFMNLIFPFKYQGPHCSILPENNAGIIEQEKYFVFGINEKWEEKINKNNIINYFYKKNLNVFKAVLICDIDNKKVITYRQHGNLIVTHNDKYKNPNFNIKIISTPKNNNANPLSNGEKCKLPQKYGDKLKVRLEKHLKSKSIDEYLKDINKNISEEFFYFLVSILKDYNYYLFNEEKDIITINDLFLKENIKKINIEQLFNLNQFVIKGIEKNDDPYFFAILLNTNLFKNFLYRKYQNHERDKYDFLLFDETIVMKKNKNELIKVKTKFLESNKFSTKNNYIINKFSEFQEDELEIINSKKDELINYFQNYDGNKFSYYIFPKLLYDNKFLEANINIADKFYNDQLRKYFSEYESISKELEDKEYFKIYEGGLINRYNFDKNKFVIKNEMRNNVGYLWLSVFCFTFYYCDDNDKVARFQELINNLKIMDNTLLSKKKLIYYIFMTLINFANDTLITKFYDYLNSRNLNTYEFYDVFCNRMLLNGPEKEKVKNNLILKTTNLGNTEVSFNCYKDKNQIESENKGNLKESDKNEKNKYNLISKRGFNLSKNKNTNNSNEEMEEIQFGCVSCPFCNEELDLAHLLESNRSKRRELACKKCKKLFIPKCTVKIGSFITNFKLLHPYYLFNEVALKLIKKYGTKIDLNILKDEYPEFYWGCILYFTFCSYSFDMMVKYKNK